jgi:phage shock protein PspC (stress-responsive transcriptional regulator)
MHTVIDVSLSGHAAPFRLQDDAYERLRGYLDRARAGLTDDTDQAEVIDDLERSIGDKLTSRLGDDRQVIDAADVQAVLDEIGAVEPDGAVRPTPAPYAPPTRRRLYRITEGQQWAGVCTGLAAYAQVDVSLVRWIFVLLGLVTVGLFLLAYVVAMFVMPVVPTQAAFAAAQRAD